MPGKILTALTWNIEGMKKNVFALKNVLEQKLPDLVFLSEPQVFQSHIISIMEYLKGEYCFFLNSDDLHDQYLPLTRNYSMGGTLCLWRKWLDPYVTIQQPTSPSFTPILIKVPNHQTSVHIGIYLPTHGKDTEFISDLADLSLCLEELSEKHPDAVVFVRGDGNVNNKKQKQSGSS